MARFPKTDGKAPSSFKEGVGGGGAWRDIMRLRATELRNNPTEPEKRLWQGLRKSQIIGFKFRRQRILGRRIVDFYCPRAKLVVEVDGETHDWSEDIKRDYELAASYGVGVQRFTNEEVMQDLDAVLFAIASALGEGNHPPTPSLGRRGRRP